MSAGRVARAGETRAVDDLLDAAAQAPAGLIFEGEPGIGKTTSWLGAIDRATARGVRVLSSRPAQTESVLAYAGLTDLLSSVDPSTWADLPRPQQQALDRALLRVDVDDAGTDRRAVAAAFKSVLDALATSGTVLVAVDDLQWIDPSTAHVLAFALRRMTGPVGVLAAVRTSPDTSAASWLELARPERLRRMSLQPLDFSALHVLVSDRLGRSFSKPTMQGILDTSGGNPLFALELARSVHENPGHAFESLPGSLTELVQARIGTVDAVAAPLLAASCLAAPSVDLVAQAVDADPRVVLDMLEPAEEQGIIHLDGAGLRFTHPLLARGVYLRASAAERRSMHRRLADVVREPELRARHLALAVTRAEPATLRALDDAAEIARSRGAPKAAAELATLAVKLGGDSPERRIRLASYHFSAGDSEHARDLLERTVDSTPAGHTRATALHLLALVRMMDDDFVEAADLSRRAIDEAGEDQGLRVQTLVMISFALFNSGDLASAVERVDDAVRAAEALGDPHLTSQALSTREMLRFLHGDGFDTAKLQQALQMENLDIPAPSAFRPRVQHAVLLACVGRMDEAHEGMAVMRRHYLERGDESELMFIDYHSVFLEIWRGNFTEAAVLSRDLMERVTHLGGDLPQSVGLTARAALAAYTGRIDEARSSAMNALSAGQRANSQRLSEWPVTILGFLDVSLGRYQAALTSLQSEISRLDAAPHGTEIISASFVPDAVEAMVNTGRLADAEPFVALLEGNGRRLDRPWMLAMGARCRAMLEGARGEVDIALEHADEAMTQHDRLDMPFERARTQLLLGQLQRRRRRQDAAAASIRQALDTFDRLGTVVWAERARVQLTRTNVGPRGSATLTPSEQRVAELAATGMTNRDMAAALFVSPKTVEANLSRVYRKLGIHSRAELGRWVGDASR